MRFKLRSEKIAGAAGVRQQMLDRYFRGDFFVGIVREVFADGIVERDFSCLHQLEDGDGGKHFIHGADAEFRTERVWDSLLAIGQAVSACENRLAVFSQEHGPANLSVEASFSSFVRSARSRSLWLKRARGNSAGRSTARNSRRVTLWGAAAST